jgi:hypothetical protein
MYLWKKFNIKTFPANTAVFVDGKFKPELSTIVVSNQSSVIRIDKFYKLPIHIIYIGEISGKNEINIEIIPNDDPASPRLRRASRLLTTDDRRVFLTAKLTSKKPAFLNILSKNTGKNSEFHGKILVQNYGQLEINEKAGHFDQNTGIFISTKVVAHSKSTTKLSAIAEIAKGCENCKSDISFAALAATDAKIQFSPAQRISAAPDSAGHSASIWRGLPPQIQYLCESGLSGAEVKQVLEESFINM